MPGMEAVVNAAIASLKAGFAAKAAALNALFGDAFTIVAPHESSYLIAISDEELRSELLQLANPTVLVQGGDVLRSGDEANPDLGGEYRLANALSVSVLFQAPTITERTRLTWRYERAVKEILLSGAALVIEETGERVACVFEGAGYLEKTIPAGVWRDAVTVVSVETHETP